MDKRDFKGIWIPADIYLSKEIGWPGKLIFLEIDSFTSREMDCFFSNEYLAEFFDISVPSVSRYVNRLIEIGWVEQTCFDGRKRHLRSCRDKAALSKVIRQGTQKRSGSIRTFDKDNNKSVLIPINKEEIHIHKYSLKKDNKNTLNTVLNNTNTISSENSAPEDAAFYNFLQWINDEACMVGKMKMPFTKGEFLKLLQLADNNTPGHSWYEIRTTLRDMHNWAPLCTKNVSAFTTLSKWLSKKREQKTA